MPGKGCVAEPGLSVVMPGRRRDHHRAGLGLPPGIHHRTAAAADVLPVPDPCLGVDGLAHAAQQAQRRHVVPVGILLAPAHEGADGRGRGVADGAGVLLDDGPETIPVGVVGRAFVHHRGRAVGQRAVDDVAMAGDPTDVSGAPVHIVFLEVEDPLAGGVGAGHVAAGGVDDALGLARGAAGVQHEQHVLAVHLLRLAGQRLVGYQVMPPDIAALDEGHVVAGALDDDHLFHRRIALDGCVGVELQRDDAAAPPAAIGGNHHLGLRVLDAIPQGLGAEPAEHDAVGRADAGAGQHGDGQLRHHGHVQRDPVALIHAQALQPVGELADLAVQVAVGVHLPVSRLALPDDGRLVLARPVQVPVDAVVGCVELAAHEPLGERRVRPVQHGVPGLEPVQLAGEPGPERFGVPAGFFVHARVGDVGVGRELGRRRIRPVFLQQGLKSAGVLSHGGNPPGRQSMQSEFGRY